MSESLEGYTVSIRDVGTVVDAEIPVAPGVTILTGGHGVGKSTCITAVAIIAGAKEKLPVRDGAAVGTVRGLGTTLTITREKTTRAGERFLDSAEERLDVATFVDPGIKDDDAALSKRVKSIMSLTGQQLEIQQFADILPERLRDHLAASDRDADPVVMARKVKKRMETFARAAEETADRHAGAAEALEKQFEGVDLLGESDAVKLSAALEAATAEKIRINERARNAERAAAEIADARAKLAAIAAPAAADAIAARVFEAESQANDARQAADACRKQLDELRVQVNRALQALELAEERQKSAANRLADVKAEADRMAEQTKTVDDLRQQIAKPPIQAPSADDLAAAEESVAEASAAVARGAKIREARDAQAKIMAERKAQAEAIETAEIYRKAAAATNDVLTRAVACKYLAIVDGDLCAIEGEGGKPERFARLSSGERWRLAILEIARALAARGRPAILTLPQEAWEGLNTASRDLVSDTAKAAGLSIVTAEITDEPELGSYRWRGNSAD